MDKKILEIVEICMYLNKNEKDFAVECWVRKSHVKVIIEAPSYMVNHTVILNDSRYDMAPEEQIDSLSTLLKGIVTGERSPLELMPGSCRTERKRGA